MILGDNPVRLTFPDGGTIDLAVGQEIEVEVVEAKPRGTTNCGGERKLTPKAEPTTGWEWVRDSMRRGDEAAVERQRAEEARLRRRPSRFVDGEGDTWVRDAGGTYATTWAGDSGYWSGWTYEHVVDAFGVGW
ncbi:hypothetical protein GCM10028799_56890 [Kribbella italica]